VREDAAREFESPVFIFCSGSPSAHRINRFPSGFE